MYCHNQLRTMYLKIFYCHIHFMCVTYWCRYLHCIDTYLLHSIPIMPKNWRISAFQVPPLTLIISIEWWMKIESTKTSNSISIFNATVVIRCWGSKAQVIQVRSNLSCKYFNIIQIYLHTYYVLYLLLYKFQLLLGLFGLWAF